jgi:hypothetical protein
MNRRFPPWASCLAFYSTTSQTWRKPGQDLLSTRSYRIWRPKHEIINGSGKEIKFPFTLTLFPIGGEGIKKESYLAGGGFLYEIFSMRFCGIPSAFNIPSTLLTASLFGNAKRNGA